MPVYHIVAFKLHDSSLLPKLTSEFLALEKGCVRPNGGGSYIKSVKGGRNISTEKIDHGMEVVFIMEMENEKDLAYYIDEDPVHTQFKNLIRGELNVAGVVAMDFVDGTFPK